MFLVLAHRQVVAVKTSVLLAGEPGGGATEIALDACNAVADTIMTLADVRKVDQWRIEYISLGEEPTGNFLPAGELTV